MLQHVHRHRRVGERVDDRDLAREEDKKAEGGDAVSPLRTTEVQREMLRQSAWSYSKTFRRVIQPASS